MAVPILGQPPMTSREIGGEPNEPKIRILICKDCKDQKFSSGIEELPDYLGRPENDHLLQKAIEDRHTWPTGTTHVGMMATVAVSVWSNAEARHKIIDQIWGGSQGIDEHSPGFYDTRNNFYEDAMRCFEQHLRPMEGCPDYRDTSKRLVPNTARERKDAGLLKPSEVGGPKTYLCDFCPAKQHYVRKAQEKMGLYK